MTKNINELERILKALANKRRLAIIQYLIQEKEATVGDIAEHIKLSFKATSKHLGILANVDIVERSREVYRCGISFHHYGIMWLNISLIRSNRRIVVSGIIVVFFKKIIPDIVKVMAKYIIGIDEVGRGPLAGPITIAALAAMGNSKSEIRNPKLFKKIKDSKRLSVKQREEWFKILREHSKDNRLFYAVSSVSNSVIDKKGIAHATRLAVRRSLRKIALLNSKFSAKDGSALGGKILNSRILLDGGLKAPKEYTNQQTIPKGDLRIPIIAAASIMAKVTRDRKMVRLAEMYPKYGFEVHKGYGTKMHIQKIKKYGLCDLHRRSFCGKFISKLNTPR